MKFPTRPLLTLSALIAFSFAFVTTSCKKSNSTPDSGSGPFFATMSGTVYQPSKVAAFDQQSYVNIEGLQVKSGDSISLQLSFHDTEAVTAVVDFNHATIKYFDTKKLIRFETTYPAHGTITFSSWDKTNRKIAGEFSGVLYGGSTGTDSVVITNGQFNTAYEQW